MKKVVATLLSVLVAVTLFACAKTETPNAAPSTTPSSSPSSSPAVSPSTVPSDAPSADTSKIGWYNPERDYAGRDPYKVVYISYQGGTFGELLEANFKGWASVLNIDYTRMDAPTMDTFYSTMEVYANEGYDGYILDGDPVLADKTIEYAKELDIKAWLPAMSTLRSADGKMMWPGVTMDSAWAGREQISWAWDNYSKYLGEGVDTANLGVIFVDYSVIPNLHLTEEGTKGWLSEKATGSGFNMDNYFVADAAGLAFNAETAYTLVSTIISSNSNISHWIICTCMEPYGVGASRACEDMDKIGKAIVVSQDGTTLFDSWDNDYEGCWVAALTSPLQYFTEPTMCGILALIEGEATPETLWPESVAPGDTYANNVIYSTMLTKENYKEFLADLVEKAPF